MTAQSIFCLTSRSRASCQIGDVGKDRTNNLTNMKMETILKNLLEKRRLETGLNVISWRKTLEGYDVNIRNECGWEDQADVATEEVFEFLFSLLPNAQSEPRSQQNNP